MSLLWVLAAALVCGASGLPPLLVGRVSNRGQVLAAILSVGGSILGLVGVVLFLLEDGAPALSLPWSIPGGAFSVALDGLGAVFLVPVFVVSGLGAVYGLGYWRQSEHPEDGRRLRAAYGLLTGSMVLLLVARSSVLFLMGWETMALAAYFLVAIDHRQASVRQAAWVYLVATHIGTAALFALFVWMRDVSGTFEWTAIPDSSGGGPASAIFILAVCGFGLKAGILPFHVWLPSAHASAPSHVSGLLSGVMIKMGVYGIIRISGYLPHPPLWWGALLLGMGVVSGIVGVASAIGQRDLKRMLAYSSIENVGIITSGIGLALLGRALGAQEWVALGLGGALLHVANHSLFKSLLFLSAGSIIHATHTRAIDELGGLARSMPLTFLGFLAGSWAVCGLPLMNGFPGELLLYVGFFKAAMAESLAPRFLASLAIAGLALTGALAVACFVRALGAVFLGTGRSERTSRTKEAPASMTGVLMILASACLALGVAPLAASPLMDRAVRVWAPEVQTTTSALVPLGDVGLLLPGVAVAAAISSLLLFRLSRTSAAREAAPPEPVIGTWDCGYADPSSPRLQYTASSLGEMLAGIFRWAIRLEERRPRLRGPFPSRERYGTEPTEPFLADCLVPFCTRWADRCSRLRILQRGNLQIYLVYILVTLVLLIAWAMIGPQGPP